MLRKRRLKQSLLIDGINDFLARGLEDTFVFDESLARKEGKVTLCYRETSQPVPLEVELTEIAIEKDRLNWREVHRAVKDRLPENVIRQLVSNAKTLVRGSSRRMIKDVERDIRRWQEAAFTELVLMFGWQRAQAFKEEIVLPADVKPGTLHALQYVVDANIDRLQNF